MSHGKGVKVMEVCLMGNGLGSWRCVSWEGRLESWKCVSWEGGQGHGSVSHRMGS